MANVPIILHLGAHKTGTTSVQKWCTDNTLMLQKSGIVYIDFTHKPWSTYRTIRHLCDSARGEGETAQLDERVKMVQQNLDKLISNPKVTAVVIPWEIFLGEPKVEGVPLLYPMARPVLDKLKTTFPELPIKIVYTIRDQWSFLNSWFQQVFKLGRVPDPENYVRWAMESDLSWGRVVGQLEDVFGPENVTVLDYANPDLFTSVLALYGIKVSGSIDVPHVNKGWPAPCVDIARFAMPKLNEVDRYKLRLLLDAGFAEHPAPSYKMLDAAAKEFLDQRYGDENRALIARLGKRDMS